jgi:hypothetical protein
VLLTAVVVVVALAFGVNVWRSSRKARSLGSCAVAERQPITDRGAKYKAGNPYKDPFILPINFEPDYHIRLQVESASRLPVCIE